MAGDGGGAVGEGADGVRGPGDGSWDIGILLIATWKLEGKWEGVAVDVNGGYTFSDRFRPPLREGELFLGTAVRAEVSEHLWLVGEVFGAAPGGSMRRLGGAMVGGVQYEAAEGAVLDAAIGTGLGQKRPRWVAAAGFTWSF